MNDPIASLLDHLHVCREQGDILAAREALEDYIETEVDRVLAGLVGTAELAQLWGVSVRRAQAHVAWLHERQGIGMQLGGSWFLWRDQAEEYRPGQPGRPKTKRNKTMSNAFEEAISRQDWYEAAQALREHCTTSIDQLDTWLANGDIQHIRSRTPQELATEYDEWNSA